ncbi:MAG: TlpA family protein disulfide reductase [Sphingomonadales bacterium]|jgi:thiol-disulfide isomerase/thioredoxin
MKKLSVIWITALLLCLSLQAQEVRLVNDAALLKCFNEGEKPRIINFWATWCKPCMEEMPHFVKADSVFGHQIDFVFVSFDRVKDTARVMQKIAEYKIPGEHLLIRSSDIGNLIDAVDSSWGGALPTTWIAHEQYRVVRQEAFEQFTDLKRFIETYLNRKE